MTAGSVPDNLIGVWQRESIRIADGKAFEDSQVFWLQGSKRYADFRVPLADSSAAQQASAGNQTWQDPTLQFHHELDFSQSAQEDVGDLSWDGEVLLENGSVTHEGKVIHYEERWLRITPVEVISNTWEVRRADNTLRAIAIQVGDFAAIVTGSPDFGASLHGLQSSWAQTLLIGIQPGLFCPWATSSPAGDGNPDWLAVL